MTEQVTVSLGLDIIYIYGTVNGEVATWELTSPGVWSAVVAKAPNGRYDVEITAYNSLGTSTTYATTLYRGSELLPLKTDWTRDDYYNAEDINRVEINTQFIADSLTVIGYPVELESIVGDRDMRRIEFADSLSRVERNIDALATAFIAPPGYQPPREWAALMAFDWRDASRLERNLQLLYTWMLHAVAGFRRCGALTCGEGGDIY